MNLYIRYFDQECLVGNVDEAFDFLSSLQDIPLDEDLREELLHYVESPMPYPKRYKVRPRVYFIVIKTEANSLSEFKQNKPPFETHPNEIISRKTTPATHLTNDRPGWYEGRLTFKRVIMIPGTGKFQYIDTTFVAHLKAYSGLDCYNRIISHLRSRQDVDPRSQFTSAKGKNFSFSFLGTELPK